MEPVVACKDGNASSPRQPLEREHASTPMRIALYQPDIPQNTGAIMRLAACLGVALDLIEPAGFLLSDRRLKRVGMDYLKALELRRHRSWDAFLEQRPPT